MFPEFISGVCAVLDFWVLFIMSIYLALNWEKRGSLPYCAATAIVIYVLGETINRVNIWTSLWAANQLPLDQVSSKYSLVMSVPYTIGMSIIACGLFKLVLTFGKPYGGKWIWIPALVSALIIPGIAVILT